MWDVHSVVDIDDRLGQPKPPAEAAQASTGQKGLPMHAPDENVTRSRSVLMKLLVRSWDYRHPYVFAGLRLAAGIWLVVLGALCTPSATGGQRCYW
jgi:hypothetical protein